MKVYYVDTDYGYQEVLLENEITQEELQELRHQEGTFVRELDYTKKQIDRAKKLRNDDEYCYKFEQDTNFAPNLLDILIKLYGDRRVS